MAAWHTTYSFATRFIPSFKGVTSATSQCRFDFVTMEGNPPCADPMTCEHGAEARSHVRNYKRWLEARGITVP